METPDSGLRQVLGESFAESLRNPPPPHTPRRVHGRIRFPGKATAVFRIVRTTTQPFPARRPDSVARRHEWILTKRRNNISTCRFRQYDQDLKKWIISIMCTSGQR